MAAIDHMNATDLGLYLNLKMHKFVPMFYLYHQWMSV